jgi:hypothetical protein
LIRTGRLSHDGDVSDGQAGSRPPVAFARRESLHHEGRALNAAQRTLVLSIGIAVAAFVAWYVYMTLHPGMRLRSIASVALFVVWFIAGTLADRVGAVHWSSAREAIDDAPLARRIVIAYLAVATAVGVVALANGSPWLHDLSQAHREVVVAAFLFPFVVLLTVIVRNAYDALGRGS